MKLYLYFILLFIYEDFNSCHYELRINLVYNNVCSSFLLVESSTIGQAHTSGGHLAAVEGYALAAEQVLGARLSWSHCPWTRYLANSLKSDRNRVGGAREVPNTGKPSGWSIRLSRRCLRAWMCEEAVNCWIVGSRSSEQKTRVCQPWSE
jgi:hypothetical protein